MQSLAIFKRFGERAVAPFFLITLCCASVHSAVAATLNVSNTGDSGPGSLRAVLAAASNNDAIEFDAALFTSELPVTIELTSGPLVIGRNVDIIGPGDASNHVPMLNLSGRGTQQLVQVNSGVKLTVTGLALSNGRAAAGGAVHIAAGANVTFIACDFRGNIANGNTGGGAIFNEGTLRLDECLVANNGAAAGSGGGIVSIGTTTITRSLLVGNAATGFGGGVFANDGYLAIETSTFSANLGGTGGGVALLSRGSANPTATVNAATFAHNRSEAQAGGFYVQGAGAIANIGGSIFAYNVITNGSGSDIPRDLATSKSGKVNSADYNIVIKPGETLSPSALHDQVNVDPLLAPLAFNGGRTPTYALRPSSPALDQGNPAFASLLASPITTDQRGGGFPRVFFGRVDVGAFEDSGPRLICTDVILECQGHPTEANLTASLILPGGGNIAVTWTVNGVSTGPTTMMNLPPGELVLQHPGAFNDGTNDVSISVTWGGGVLSCDFTVDVVDTTPPVISLNGASNTTIEFSGTYTEPGATASDLCDGNVDVSTTGTVDSCTPGSYSIVYTAVDDAGNEATATRIVLVSPPALTITVPDTVPLLTDTDSETTTIDLANIISIEGLAGCDSTNWLVYVVEVLNGDGEVVSDPNDPLHLTLPIGDYSVSIQLVFGDDVLGESEFDLLVQAPNVVWPLALNLQLQQDPGDENLKIGSIQQLIAKAGESRWYKVHGAPGGRIEVVLTNLPANYDVVVYSDIQEAYDDLIGLINGDSDNQLLALLGAEFSPEAYSPEAYSPEAYSPEAYSPEAYSPEAYSPEAYSPEAYSPEAYSPEAYSPEAYSPEAYSPEAYSPEAYSPEAYSPEAYSPEAYASAQTRSRIAFSALPGTASEGIRFNTYTSNGEFYIRVRGQNGVFSTTSPYDLVVAIEQDLCTTVVDTNTDPGIGVPDPGLATSLIVWDSSRMATTSPATHDAEIDALMLSINAFSQEANAVVVDVADNPRIAALNAQADDNAYCPYAKNLVAEAIRNLITAYRTVPESQIADITLIGPDSVIPFFRTNDDALLASEANYFPPVLDPTHSQSALRYAQVLTQDPYGSSCEVFLATGPYILPQAPVGRLVESAIDVKAYLDAYKALFDGSIDDNGVLPLSATPTALSVGYDFLADVATAMQIEFADGLGVILDDVDTLISDIDLPPVQGWTADDWRAAFLGAPHDINYLGGHFSTSGALAADYTTRFTAAELDASLADFAYALIMSPGCHSGYSTVDGDAVPMVTEQPDWAQAFARKFATLIAGTGYQYGDTDFIEYTERLNLEVMRALRRGTGPVGIGEAIVAAKNLYLSETPIMRGIHEKTLLQVALYGLPMVKIDLPGERLTPVAADTDIASVTPVPSGPGADPANSLKVGELAMEATTGPHELFQMTETLDVIDPVEPVSPPLYVGADGKVHVDAHYYYTPTDGFVSIPGEPVRPLARFNVSQPGPDIVRGIGFRSGSYADEPGFVPFTGAAATETRGVHGQFLTEVFYPAQPWILNQIGLLCNINGISVLNVFPAQFLSDGPEAIMGTSRRYTQMGFSVFYSPNITEGALAIPPAINVISSEFDGTISVEVGATLAAGVQEVWLTYTGLPGSTFYGSWQSLTLDPPEDPLDRGIGTWTGTLDLEGNDPAQVRFMAQAVNGVGAVTLNANFGRYFKLGDSTLDEIGTSPTTLSLVAPVPSEGVYRETVQVQAQLTGTTEPAGHRVVFRVGPVVQSTFTDGSGIATANLLLNARPDVYDLEASFAGDGTYASSSDSEPVFTIHKRPTTLAFDSAGFVPDASFIRVALRADDGTPLKERTVIFKLENDTETTAVAEITDGTGRARLTRSDLSGNYDVTAYFGQSVPMPDGTIALSDPIYGPSSASASFTVGAVELNFAHEQAWLNYSDQTAPATAENRALSSTEIAGDFAADDLQFGPDSVLVAQNSKKVAAQFHAVLSGQTIADGAMVMDVKGGGKNWRGLTTLPDGTTVDLNVDWDNSGGTGTYHVWINTPDGSGPLYADVPVILTFELIIGVGSDEHPASGVSVIGGDDKPWTSENANSRTRIP